MGSRLQPIRIEDGVTAFLVSLIATLALGALLLAAGHPGDAAVAVMPTLLIGALAHSAGLNVQDNPRGLLLLCSVAFVMQQGIASLFAMG
ncbi:hypothetical protein [Cognatilysobacter bugurensis]|nr:hypothetical protein [Lysobacter bugurensis]